MFEKTSFLLDNCFVYRMIQIRHFRVLHFQPNQEYVITSSIPANLEGLATGLMSPCSSPGSSAAERSPDSVLHTPTGPAPEIMPGEVGPNLQVFFF